MKKFVYGVFILTAATIPALLLLRPKEGTRQTQIVTPQIVNVQDSSAQIQNKTATEDDIATMISFIPLQANEELLQILSVDFDGDGMEDQINAVRRGTDPSIILLVGIYNSLRGVYERVNEIMTGIAQQRTFNYSCVDITGTHRNALVYQGFLPSGECVMRIFHGVRTRSNFSLSTIGDFRSDGTIFIQRVDRYDSYETLGGAGTSYPVWVYSSDLQSQQTERDEERTRSLDQLQTMYDWDASRGRYVQIRQTRVAGQRLAQSEIQRIQDGTVATFAGFLDGLWYKTGVEDISYVFFNFTDKEVTFYSGSSQEVYSWESSSLRRNGIYISTLNTSISNLSRLVDVSLSGIDEIKLRVQDDVRMIIGESAFWDGSYMKISRNGEVLAAKPPAKNFTEEIVTALASQKEWSTETGEVIKFSENNYSLLSPSANDSGRFSVMYVLGKLIIEFRSETASPFFEKTYQIMKNGTSLELTPVAVTPLRVTSGSTQDIRLSARE
jgi:hypothetical protein